jgi:acetyl-CoA carboxylase biotin carboxyl carrier protein
VIAPALVRALSAALAGSDVVELELRGPGVHLRLRQDGAGVAQLAPAGPAAGEVIAAPGPGLFLDRHPLHRAPLAPSGMRVAAGDLVGLLRVGALLLPVTAPRAGVIGAALVARDSAVGFGTPLFLLHEDG